MTLDQQVIEKIWLPPRDSNPDIFHDLRHTFGSLLIQDGASLAYVKEQMGHSSIQITVDTYGHLIPGADIAWVDRLDSKTALHQDAPGTHQQGERPEEETVDGSLRDAGILLKCS